MVGAMAMTMAANTISYQGYGLFSETKCSLKMRKKINSNTNLMTSFLDVGWYARMVCSSYRNQRQKNLRKLIVNELGGQYEEGFSDVKLVPFLNLFLILIVHITFSRANYNRMRTGTTQLFHIKSSQNIRYQLYEMNPPQYVWLHNFVAENDPTDGKEFLRKLAKENQDLAERVMITRLHLYGKWIKECDHAEIYKEISDENLELMRERLLETIVWPADDQNSK